MKKVRMGAITIGQSPRDDVAEEFLEAIGQEVELLQCGALDGLSVAQVHQMAPREGEPILVTRLRDGREVKVAERYIHDRMPRCLQTLRSEGAELVVLFCTGEFPELEGEVVLLKPDLIIERMVPALLSRGKLGAILPAPEQIPLLGQKWKKTGLPVELAAASPYGGKEEDVRKAATYLKEKGADLIVLDCIGFTRAVKRIVQETTQLPVILPRTLLGRIVGELIS